jgi:ABC-type branched-subunit amino acid transport system ATPase component/branched-subunit amino acid ABC-type transport system permease component
MEHVGSLLLGLGSGAVFAALAVALVVTYRSSGVINFATGAIALYVAYTYASLRRGELLVLIPGLPNSVDLGSPLSFWPATAISLVIAALLGAILYLLVFRPLREAPELARAVASLGVLVVIQGTMAIRLGTSAVSVRPIFPTDRWELGSTPILADRVYLAATIVVLTLALAAAYRYTRFGLATRAVAETQKGAYVSGVSPDRVALLNWMVSAMVAGVAGILIAPVSPLTPVTYTLFVVPALAAAVVGRFQYLLPAAAAGLAIGMLQSEATFLAADYDWMPRTGAAELVPLVVIMVALLFFRSGLPTRGEIVRRSLGRAPRARSLLLPTLAGTAIGVFALVATSGTWRSAVIATFIAAILGLSLVVVTGYAGQVSLAQLALAGTAAFSLSYFTQSWNLPFPLAPLLACLVSTAIGVLVGLPALRVRGLMLGVVTLALAYAIEAVWFRNTQIVGTSGARVDNPSLFGIDLAVGAGKAFPRIEFGLLCLATLVAVGFGVAKLRLSRFGSAMLAVRANERSAAGVGVHVVGVKVLSFGLASFIAGLAGCLLAYRQTVVTFDSFAALGGLALLSTAYLAGLTSVWGGITAGILGASGIVFVALDRWVELGVWFPVITGVALILTLIFHPEGVASIGHRFADWLAERRRLGDRRQAAPDDDASSRPSRVTAPGGPPALRVEQLTVSYGGVAAVIDVSLDVASGAIAGLIGPNGAGKTSVIDAIVGFAPSRGKVWLSGVDLEGMAPHARVRAGLSRTFQSLELYDDLTVEENLSVAVLGTDRHLRHHAVDRALRRVDIEPLRTRAAGELSQGERQLVSIARACVADPQVLLLDEPAAGLNPTETALLGERIRAISDAGTAVLLVDHDVRFVLDLCRPIYVMDVGRVIAEGGPDEIRSNREVADAYLGTTHGSAAATS